MNTPLLDGISKCAARPLTHDFVAGIDPTGTKTLRYGIADADDSTTRNSIRRFVGVTGGIMAGSLLVPSLISGVAKGGRNLFQTKGLIAKLQSAGHGLATGFKQPYSDIRHGIQIRKYLKAIEQGKPVSVAGEKAVQKLVGSGAKEVKKIFGMQIPSTTTLMARTMAKVKPNSFADIKGRADKAMNEAMIMMALGGVINGGSSFVQYGTGQAMGKKVSPEDRRRLADKIVMPDDGFRPE